MSRASVPRIFARTAPKFDQAAPRSTGTAPSLPGGVPAAIGIAPSFRRAALTLVLAALTLGSCDSDRHATSPVEEPPAGPIQVAVQVAPTVSHGEPFHLSVTITNTSDEELVWHCADGCPIDFEVTDSTGAVVRAAGAPCTLAPVALRIAAGANSVGSGAWYGEDPAGRSGLWVPSGRYTIRGVLRNGTDRTIYGDSVIVRWVKS